MAEETFQERKGGKGKEETEGREGDRRRGEVRRRRGEVRRRRKNQRRKDSYI